MYNNMHTQLDTTLIHIATSDRPMYTSESGSVGASPMGFFDTTFLKLGVSKGRTTTRWRRHLPVSQQHGNIHPSNRKDDVEPGVLFQIQQLIDAT